MKKLLLLEPVRKKGNHQFFMDWFAHAWQEAGGSVKRRRAMPWPVLLAAARLKLSARVPFLSSRREALLVPGAGYPDSFAWPYAYTHEIVPMLWDVWPRYWPRLISSLKRHHVRTFLCTSSRVCEHVRQELPRVHAVHVPEGIDPAGYLPGKDLRERPVDLLELGRRMPFFHRAALRACREHPERTHLYPAAEGPLLFPDFRSLCEGLASAKITVSYPRCDTHPEMAGEVETLTQRYWECMLSRTLPAGRAPQELIDLLGYNPVMEVDERNAHEQITRLLTDIDSFQDLVDKNYRAALRHASWSTRLSALLPQLARLGYRP